MSIEKVLIGQLRWAPFFAEPEFSDDEIEKLARRMGCERFYDRPLIRPIKTGSDGVYMVDAWQVITGWEIVLAASRSGVEIIEAEIDWELRDEEAVGHARLYRDRIAGSVSSGAGFIKGMGHKGEDAECLCGIG